MPKVLEIAKIPHPILKQVAGPVENISDPKIQELIDNMLITFGNNLGLAAPQVFQPLRILIVACKPHPSYPDAPLIEPTPIINPTVINQSSETILGWEGCLSIPDTRVKVYRPKTIMFSYFDRAGVFHDKVVCENLPARIFLHENDHLDGILITNPSRVVEQISEQQYQDMVAQKK